MRLGPSVAGTSDRGRPRLAALYALRGPTWSWLDLRYRNVYAAWVSHVFADVVIFAIGYRLLFG